MLNGSIDPAYLYLPLVLGPAFGLAAMMPLMHRAQRLAPDQSSRIFAAFTTFPHRAISLRTNSPVCSGVDVSASAPIAWNFSRTSGSLNGVHDGAVQAVDDSRGVPAGAIKRVPRPGFEARQALLDERRQVGRDAAALRARDRDAAQASGR